MSKFAQGLSKLKVGEVPAYVSEHAGNVQSTELFNAQRELMHSFL